MYIYAYLAGTWMAASNELFVVGAVVVVLVGTAIGLFSRAGSEISHHPRGSRRGADTPADADPGDAGELPGSEGRRFPSTRGTR